VAQALLFIGAGTFASLVTGAALGAVGSLVLPAIRLALFSLVVVGLAVVGMAQLAWRRVIQPWQLDRETSQRWLRKGPISWSIRNGMALGFGATSRLGYWLWYLVPVGAFVSGGAISAAVVYGLYGLSRTLPALILFLEMRLGRRGVSHALLERYERWQSMERVALVAALVLLVIPA
jgi:hypothetical protein